MGHFQLFNFSGHFGAAQILTFIIDSCVVSFEERIYWPIALSFVYWMNFITFCNFFLLVNLPLVAPNPGDAEEEEKDYAVRYEGAHFMYTFEPAKVKLAYKLAG